MSNIIEKDREWLKEQVEEGVEAFIETEYEYLVGILTRYVCRQLYIAGCAINSENPTDEPSDRQRYTGARSVRRRHRQYRQEIGHHGRLIQLIKTVKQTPTRLPKYQAGISLFHDGMQMRILRIHERRPQPIQPLHAVRPASENEVREALFLITLPMPLPPASRGLLRIPSCSAIRKGPSFS